DRLTYVSSPGQGFGEAAPARAVSSILHDLGYRNSDILFHDSLIVVEGISDSEILPILISKANKLLVKNGRVGFPYLDGTNSDAKSLQTQVLRFERFIASVGRKVQHTYLLDGDKQYLEGGLLQKTKTSAGEPVKIAFLPVRELEHYLL